MDKTVCPGRDYIAFLDPHSGRITFRGIVRFAVNLLLGWFLIVVAGAVIIVIGTAL